MRRSGFSWMSEAGREAVKRLDAYGELRRMEMAGEFAVTTQAGAGGRGKPAEMAGVLQRAWDVEFSLRDWGVAPGCRLLRLLDFVWASGREDRLVAYRYVLHDGAEHGALRMTPEEVRERGEPGRYVERQEERAMAFTFDWDDFEDEGIDAQARSYSPPRGGAGSYMDARAELLGLLHDRFGAFLARRRGLGACGPASPPASAIVPHPDSLPGYGAATEEEAEFARVGANSAETGNSDGKKGEDTPIRA